MEFVSANLITAVMYWGASLRAYSKRIGALACLFSTTAMAPFALAAPCAGPDVQPDDRLHAFAVMASFLYCPFGHRPATSGNELAFVSYGDVSKRAIVE